MAELAEACRSADRHRPNETLDFYSSTGLYVWEQMHRQASPDSSPFWRTLQRYLFPARHPRVCWNSQQG
jgi:hypothetical protein